MTTHVIAPPAAIVSVETARAHLRLDGTEQDLEVAALVAAAQGTIDGPNGWLGRALGPQVLELSTGSWQQPFRLPYPPITSIVSIEYDTYTGDVATIDPAVYRLGSESTIRLQSGETWPTWSCDIEDRVRIRYEAGWPIVDDAWTGPAPIRHAVLMMVSRLYAGRGEDVSGSVAEDRTIAALLAPFRIWTL